jgi:hypothetical protein
MRPGPYTTVCVVDFDPWASELFELIFLGWFGQTLVLLRGCRTVAATCTCTVTVLCCLAQVPTSQAGGMRTLNRPAGLQPAHNQTVEQIHTRAHGHLEIAHLLVAPRQVPDSPRRQVCIVISPPSLLSKFLRQRAPPVVVVAMLGQASSPRRAPRC